MIRGSCRASPFCVPADSERRSTSGCIWCTWVCDEHSLLRKKGNENTGSKIQDKIAKQHHYNDTGHCGADFFHEATSGQSEPHPRSPTHIPFFWPQWLKHKGPGLHFTFIFGSRVSAALHQGCKRGIPPSRKNEFSQNAKVSNYIAQVIRKVP